MRQGAFEKGKSVVLLNNTLVTSGGGDQVSAELDMRGFDSAKITVIAGPEHASDTWNSSNYYNVIAKTSATSGGSLSPVSSTYCDCATDGLPDSNGVVAKLDDAAEGNKGYSFDWTGKDDFMKLTINPNGTLTNGTYFTIIAELTKGKNLIESNT